MFDYNIIEEAKKVKEEVRAFTKDEVPHDLFLLLSIIECLNNYYNH